jgi:hypothetical protein
MVRCTVFGAIHSFGNRAKVDSNHLVLTLTDGFPEIGAEHVAQKTAVMLNRD